MSKPTIFISYSHKDAEWKDRLVTHLGVLQLQNHLDFWTDDEIQIGDAWFQSIQTAMNEASVAILLVSANFLTSRFVLREEIKRLREREEQEGFPIFPILVRPCAWEYVPWLAKMQIRPKYGVPLSAGNEHQVEENLTAIVREIKTILEKAAGSATKPPPPLQDAVPLSPSNPRRETEPPLPPDPPPRVAPLPQPVKRSWRSWFSLPRVRVALSLSVSFVAVLVAVVSLFPRQDKQTLDIPSTTVESPPSKTEKKPSDSNEMIAIPAGEFWMGCDEKTDTQCESDEKPGRTVYLDAYSIGTYEVTVADYRLCVEAGACSDKSLTDDGSCNWGKKDKDNHPINCVDWDQARTYCHWTGKRLPTEAEWEKAARGKEDRRMYPWGDSWDAKNTNTSVSGTVAVGSYAAGVSPYGVHDMAGNVWEWAQDWYDTDYYKQGGKRNPRGPDTGTSRVLRGGSWLNAAWNVRVAYRRWGEPGRGVVHVGFRCAQ